MALYFNSIELLRTFRLNNPIPHAALNLLITKTVIVCDCVWMCVSKILTKHFDRVLPNFSHSLLEVQSRAVLSRAKSHEPLRNGGGF